MSLMMLPRMRLATSLLRYSSTSTTAPAASSIPVTTASSTTSIVPEQTTSNLPQAGVISGVPG